jgi:PAS domain S-box-containing protein
MPTDQSQTREEPVVNDLAERRRLEEELRHARQQLERAVRERTAELEGANEALVESQDRFRQMAESIRDVFWLSNPSRTSIIYVNPAYETIWGRTCRELYANPRSWLDGVHAEDRPRVREYFARPIGAEGYEHSYRVMRPDYSVRWVLDRGFPVRDSGGRFYRVVAIARDITDRKELEKEILAISEREQHRIGQDLHDDLCQQLAGIEFLSKALQPQVKGPAQAARLAEIAGLIRGAIEHTRRLARGLAPLELEAEGLMQALQSLAGRTTDVFRVNCAFNCPAPVLIRDLTTGTHLYRIAQEAATNSVKHGKAKRIEIELAPAPGGGVLFIKDDGVGFAGGGGDSAGMGLRIMRYRADMIGGTVSIETKPSGGTSVACTFPLTK